MLTSLSSAEGLSAWCSLRSHSDGGQWQDGAVWCAARMAVCAASQRCSCGSVLMGSTREHTAIMAWHQLLCSQSVSALCRVCASVEPWAVPCCPRKQDAYPWDRRGRQPSEPKVFVSDAASSVHLSFDKHSVSINIF